MSEKESYGTFQQKTESQGSGTDVHAPMSCFGALTTLPRDKWEWKWFSTVKGSDWLHLYMWMVKDLAWAQGWYAVGMISGAAALVWSAVLEYLALKEKNYVEA